MRALFLLLVLAAPLAAAQTTFSLHGLIGHGVAACAPAAGCSGVALPQEQVFSLGQHSRDVHIDATLVWARSTPLAEELRLGVSYDDATKGRVHAFVQGSSPVTLDVVVPAAGELLIWANFPQTLEPAPVWVSAQQTFQIDGSLD